MKQILAVGMLDVETFGRAAFFVQVSETEVMHYLVHRNGHIEANPPVPLPLTMVYSSVEKFNHGYLVDEPVPIKEVSELPDMCRKWVQRSNGSRRAAKESWCL
jgi:hypothetical protein